MSKVNLPSLAVYVPNMKSFTAQNLLPRYTFFATESQTDRQIDSQTKHSTIPSVLENVIVISKLMLQ